MKKNKLVVALLSIIASLFFGIVAVHAETGGVSDPVMTISPPQQKIVLAPGELYEGSIKVSNTANSNRDLKYSVVVGSFGLGKDENGDIDYNYTDTETITAYNQMMEWIELKKTSGSVAPNTTDTIPFIIKVPEDAPGGGQYATIIIQDDTNNDLDSGGNVAIKNVIRFAASIFAEVTGKTREEGAILENSIPPFILSNTLSVGSKVRNDGNVHTDASYVLQVWPLFSDEEFCTNEEDPSTSLIMPETERYHTETCIVPPIGIFRVKQTVTFFNEISEAEKIVLVCPLWLLFIIIFAIILMVLWLIAKARARSKAASN